MIPTIQMILNTQTSNTHITNKLIQFLFIFLGWSTFFTRSIFSLLLLFFFSASWTPSLCNAFIWWLWYKSDHLFIHFMAFCACDFFISMAILQPKYIYFCIQFKKWASKRVNLEYLRRQTKFISTVYFSWENVDFCTGGHV